MDSSPEDGQVTEKKSDLEESNKKANNAAAEQAAIDEAENEKSKSNSPDEVKASTDDEKKETDWDEKDEKTSMKKGVKGMSEGWAKTTMETLAQGAALRQEIASDVTSFTSNTIKSGIDKLTSSDTAEPVSDQEVEMEPMSDSKPLMLEGPKAEQLNTLSSESQNPEPGLSSTDELENDDVPKLTM